MSNQGTQNGSFSSTRLAIFSGIYIGLACCFRAGFGAVVQQSLRYATSRTRVVPPHAPYKATVDQGGHLADFRFLLPGFGITQSRVRRRRLFGSTRMVVHLTENFLWGRVAAFIGRVFEWYYSDVAPAKHNLICESCSTKRPIYGDGGPGWGIVGIGFRNNCEAVESSGLRDGSVSNKQTMAIGGHMETDAGPMR